LDVMMDTTTAGFQLALDLHSPDPQSKYREFRDTPIIMLTAIHSTTPLRFSPDQDYLPVQSFLEKPLDPEALLARVREALGEA
jgi:CheY-like chemotaxis protein